MEVCCVARRHILGVDRWVEEADGWFAVGNQLLVDQGNIAGPHGRREAGAAVFVCRASGLIGADIKCKVRVCRHVGAVAKSSRTLVAGVNHPREFLPRWDCDSVRRDTAAAVRPGGFRLPGASRASGDQVRAADRNDIRIVRGPSLVARRPGGRVARSRKEVLALSSHPLEVRVECGWIRRRPAP